MTDQSPTREELIVGLEETNRLLDEPFIEPRYLTKPKLTQAISLLRSDSQRIAELEGRLNGLSQGTSVAYPSVRPEGPSPAGDLDPKYWEVEVRVCGERILTIGHSHLSGLADIDRYADVIRTCAAHLSSFIGPEEPPPCFACGGSEQERWMGPSGEEVGPCSVCVPEDQGLSGRPAAEGTETRDEQIDPALQTQGAESQ